MKIFDLVIWAIIAIILIFIIINLFININQQENLTLEIRKNLEIAETPDMLGKLIIMPTKKVEENFILDKTNFDIAQRSIAIECTNPNICCPLNEKCNRIEWTPELAVFKNSRTIDFFVRCEKDIIIICKIYFGIMPAQSKIEEINLIAQEGTSTKILIKAKNIGKISIIQGINKIELYKKVNNNWEKTNEIFPQQTVDLLTQNQEHNFIWNVETKTMGEYRISSEFKGNNAGFDTMTFDFNIIENIECNIDETRTETMHDPSTGENWQIHYCNNCNFSHECVTQWNKKYPEIEWNIIDKERIYHVKNLNFEIYRGYFIVKMSQQEKEENQIIVDYKILDPDRSKIGLSEDIESAKQLIDHVYNNPEIIIEQ
jgi:hypothetical protein